MDHGFKIGKIFGIEITIDPSWIFIFLLVTFNLAVGVFPLLQPTWSFFLQWFMAILASLLFFASVLAHEIAHSLVAKARGLPISRITLFLFGGVSNLEREPASAGTEFIMAIVGPLTSIVLGIIFLFLSGESFAVFYNSFFISSQALSRLNPIQTMLLWLGPINILVGLFNLIPGFPLDGGRVLRSIIWSINNNLQASTKVAAAIGQAIGYLFILAGISMIFGISVPILGTGLFSGIWIALIGWFLTSAASQSYRQTVLSNTFSRVKIKNLMHTNIKAVPEEITIEKLVDDYMIGTDNHVFPVVENRNFLGMVCLEDIQKIPRNNWPKIKVREIMTPLDELDTVSSNQEAYEALAKITGKEIGQVPVLDKNRLVGLISRHDILLWITLHTTDKNLGDLSKI